MNVTMPQTKHTHPSRAIGRTLKSWRMDRGMSMGIVAEASMRHFEPISQDYLSRLERGHLMPSIPKLTTLAAIYGRPLSHLIDLYEVEELRRLAPRKASYDLLRRLGIEHLQKDEITDSLACFLGALDVAIRDGMEAQPLASAYNNVGFALARGGRYTTAQHFLEEGLRLKPRALTRAKLLDNLAIVHYQMDNLALADILSKEAVETASGDTALKRATLATRAAVLLDSKEYAEAEIIYRKILAEYEHDGEEAEAVRQSYNLGNCLLERDHADEAITLMESAVARAAKLGDSTLRATSLYFLGRCFYAVGRREDAGAPLKESLRIAQKVSNRNAAFHSAFYLLQLARERGDGAQAEEYEMIARQYRLRLEQRSEEVRTFDSWLAQRRRKARRQDDG